MFILSFLLGLFCVFECINCSMMSSLKKTNILCKSQDIFSHQQSFSLSHATKPKISQVDFKVLALYSKNFLENNIDKIASQKNESGFIRVNIPAGRLFSDKVEKIRLNYWAPDAGVEIIPESIHDHPRYFESLLIQGGYTHELYAHAKNEKSFSYDRYRIFKSGNKKNFMFIGTSQLQNMGQASAKKGDVLVFPKNLIHRVLHTQPSTLTLNVVFKGESDDSYYDVFISQNGNVVDVKTEREILLGEESQIFSREMIKSLQGFLN